MARCDPQQMCSRDSLGGSCSSLITIIIIIIISIIVIMPLISSTSSVLSSCCVLSACFPVFSILSGGLPLFTQRFFLVPYTVNLPLKFIPVTPQSGFVLHSYRCHCSGRPIHPSSQVHTATARVAPVLRCVFLLCVCWTVTLCGLVDGWPRDRSFLPRRIHAPLSSLPGGAY